MRTARLVGLSPDGKSLIVATESGEELAISADDRLRAAVRGDRPRLGQLEIEMESSLSPRDIQTRIRGGETLEDVARVAGIPLDRVERFAAPVFAEREHIAAQAMSSSVRRKGETSGHRSLRIAVTERLLGRGVDIDTIAWDSYRMDDGRGAVTADYLSGEAARHASFFYDLHGRFSVAGNDEARWLLGEHSAAKGPQPGRRRATERGPSEDDTEPTLDLSDDLALVRATQESDEPTVAVPRLLHPVPEPESEPEPESRLGTNSATLGGDGYADDSARVYAGLSDASAVPETAGAAGWEPAIVVNYPVEPSLLDDSEPEAAQVEADEDEPDLVGTDEPGPPDRPTNLDDRADEAHEFEVEVLAKAEEAAKKPVKRKRASVPSWDEIMFGGPKRT